MCEHPSVYSESTPKARITHTCCECRGKISPGETYHLIKGCWDGEWSDFKTCADCESMRVEFIATLKHDEDHPPFGEFYQIVFDDYTENRARRIRQFMEIRKKRGAPPSPKNWMEEALAELTPAEGGGEMIAELDPAPAFLDIPTAWAIQKRGGFEHDPKCSSVPGHHPLSGPHFLCDCGAVISEWEKSLAGFPTEEGGGE